MKIEFSIFAENGKWLLPSHFWPQVKNVLAKRCAYVRSPTFLSTWWWQWWRYFASHWKTIAHFLFSLLMLCCVGEPMKWWKNPQASWIMYCDSKTNYCLFLCVSNRTILTQAFECKFDARDCVHSCNPNMYALVHLFKSLPQIFYINQYSAQLIRAFYYRFGSFYEFYSNIKWMNNKLRAMRLSGMRTSILCSVPFNSIDKILTMAWF